MEREGAVMGILLTLYKMPNLVKEAKKYGNYESKIMNMPLPKIEVISVEELLAGKRLGIPMYSLEVVKKAEAKKETGQAKLEF
ncbi:MAG: hypothetical protein NTX03_05075 [Bacteroidetes bacterium]|nr:hypothetical protein [Bacteroidota bacterium]